MGSSHGATRIFRFVYDHPDYVALARASLAYWSELGNDVLRITGGIDIGPEGALRPCADALDAHGAPYEWLAPDEVAARASWLDHPDGAALWSPDTGVIAADATLRALAARAAEAGASIVTGAHVTSIAVADDGVALTTAAGEVRARTCVVAAGAWAPALLRPLGLGFPARVTRERVCFFSGTDATMPVIERGEHLWYAVPEMFGAPGMKTGEHHGGPEVDPDGDDGRAADPARAIAWARGRFPRARPEPVASETCLYTTTPDEDFVIDRRGPLVVVSACSGHGFKFAPLVGEIAARLVTGEALPDLPLERFALDRFGVPR